MTERVRWQRKEMIWQEETSEWGRLRHVFRPYENNKGEIYSDHSLRMITAKCFTLIFARPVHTTVKTLYHLFLPLSLPCEIYQAAKEARQNETNTMIAGVKAALKSIADIVLTPFYGCILTILAIIGFVLGIMGREENLLDLKECAGKVEQSLNWGRKKKNFWTLAPCFQKAADRKTIVEEWGKVKHANTHYASDNSIDIAEANIARAVFTSRRKKRIIFYGCRLWPKNEPLDSANFNGYGTMPT